MKIVGVDHIVQYRRDNIFPKRVPLIINFEKLIETYIKEHKITLLAEEFSEEACEKNFVNESVLQKIASCHGISHCFCDPNTIERTENNINTHGEREEFWLNFLSKYSEYNILFVCGDDHVESFNNKFIKKNKNIQSEILARSIGANQSLE